MSEIFKKYEEQMKDCIKSFVKAISKIRTGRAIPEILDGIYINYYGNKTEISKISNISVQDFRTLKINVFEKNLNPLIMKEISRSRLDLNPISVNNNIFVKFPDLTEQRRKDLLKILSKEAEIYRIMIRNFRRNLNSAMKKKIKLKEISENEHILFKKKSQDLTNKNINEINKYLLKKEKEILNI